MKKGTIILSDKKYQDKTLFDVKMHDGKYSMPKKIDLMYSKADVSWTKPGAITSKLINTGNGYVYKSYNIQGKLQQKMNIDYCQAQELRVLLKLMEDADSPAKFTFLEEL